MICMALTTSAHDLSVISDREGVGWFDVLFPIGVLLGERGRLG